MSWIWFHRTPLLSPTGSGRVGTRLLRGVRWAVVLLFLVSVLAFAAGQCIRVPEHIYY